jgi:hypothetical protein
MLKYWTNAMDAPKEKKAYTLDEIRRLAPGYKGKPENFDPRKAGRKAQPKTKSPNFPKSAVLTAPTALERNTTPTEQKNKLLLEDSIFGMDVTIIPIQPIKDISTSFARLPETAVETYNQYSIDERQLERVFTKEEMSYYATGLLWTKLIDVKAKQFQESLTREQRALRKATERVEFNVQQPIASYLHQIGHFTDKMGKKTELNVPPPPVTRVQGFGGYHAAAITVDTQSI